MMLQYRLMKVLNLIMPRATMGPQWKTLLTPEAELNHELDGITALQHLDTQLEGEVDPYRRSVTLRRFLHLCLS